MSNESRAAFEATCKVVNPRYQPTDDGVSNRRDWQIWQASRKEALSEAAEACLSRHANGNYKCDDRDDCHAAIKELI